MCQHGWKIPDRVNTAKEGEEILYDVLSQKSPGKMQTQESLQTLLKEAEEYILPYDDFAWIKTDERACYFVWMKIVYCSYNSGPLHPIRFYNSNEPIAFRYIELGLNLSPSSHDARVELIIKFFDYVKQPLNWQKQLLEYLGHEWGKIYSARKPFPWLNKSDEIQCRWSWEYFHKHQVCERTDIGSLNPTGNHELYLAILAAYDSWDAHYDSKRLFLSDFNKAWNQKKLRDNRKGKKACNMILREEVKLKLDRLAAKKGMKLNELVEELIEKEYDEISSD
ncbi:hypothetical protein [Alteromonas sp. S015]|uniref:hypothetical protein n=1 Tax=Alteromonas sp. S015 TaxID=3117401 RepID=UPI002FE30CD2